MGQSAEGQLESGDFRLRLGGVPPPGTSFHRLRAGVERFARPATSRVNRQIQRVDVFSYIGPRMPLFGRTEPLAAAARALEEAALGRGGTLVVTGEPGIGKSALARSFAAEAEARGARVGFGRAWEVGGAPAYWPWSQALTELGLDLDEVLGSASNDKASAQRLVAFDRVVRAACAGDAPLV